MTSAARKPGASKRTAKEKRTTKAAELGRIVDLRVARVRKELERALAEQEARLRALEAGPSVTVSEAQMAAREAFFAEVRVHNDEPTDAAVEAMVRSWRE